MARKLGYKRNWDAEINNKLHHIKPTITIWLTYYPRIAGFLLACLRIRHSRITHKHLLLQEDASMCSDNHFDVLSIHHILTECLGLWNLYSILIHPCLPQQISLEKHLTGHSLLFLNTQDFILKFILFLSFV